MRWKIFSCYLPYVCLWWDVYSCLLSIFQFGCLFSYSWVSRSSRIFWIHLPLHMCVLQTFSPRQRPSFYLNVLQEEVYKFTRVFTYRNFSFTDYMIWIYTLKTYGVGVSLTLLPALGTLYLQFGCIVQPLYEGLCFLLLPFPLSCLAIVSWRLSLF